MDNKVFIYGVQFYRPPNPPRMDRRKDIQRISETGFNTIKIWAMWNWVHTAPEKFELDELIEIMDYAREYNINVVVNTILENVPFWIAEKYPEAHYTNAKGMKYILQSRCNTPTGGWPGLCLDHPKVRKLAADFLAILAEKIGEYDNLLIWDCWNEPHMEPVSIPYTNFEENLYCYCPATIKKFRDWLKKRYGSLDKLNETWVKKYTSWSQIEPPRRLGGYPEIMDWRRFMNFSMAELMRWRVKTLKASDPMKHEVMSHTSVISVIDGFSAWSCDDWLFASEVNKYGLSSFPKWFNMDMPDYCCRIDAARSAANGKEIWQSELQGGRILCPPGDSFQEIETADIRWWNWLSIAHGAKAILYWQYRHEMLGPEALGGGLCERSGQFTDRLKEAANICRGINRHSRFFNQAQIPEREVAILINKDSFYLNFAAKGNESYSLKSVRGIYRLLWEQDILVDFIDDRQVMANGLSPYRVVFLPFPDSLSRDYAKKIKEYVANGGILISEACPGTFDERGLSQEIIPGYEMVDVFGVKEKHVVYIDELKEKKDPYYLKGVGPLDSLKVRVSTRIEIFDLYGAAPILKIGKSIAGTCNTFGKGKAYLIGTYWGQALSEYNDKYTKDFMVKLLINENIIKKEKNTSLIIRRLLCGEEQALVIVNPTNKTINESFQVPAKSVDAVDVLTGQKVNINNQEISVIVEPCDALCLYLT